MNPGFGNQEPFPSTNPVHPVHGDFEAPEMFAMGDYQQTFDSGNNREKRTRTTSYSEEPRAGGRFVRANLVITERGMSDGHDISDVLDALFSQNAQQAGQIQYMQSQVQDVTSINQELRGMVNGLKQQMEVVHAQPDASSNLKQKRPSKEIRNAVHEQAQSLLGVTPIRVPGSNAHTLTLPAPLNIDEVAREGLHNPNWLVEKPHKDMTNLEFMSAVVEQVVANGLTTNIHKVASDDLEDPEHTMITQSTTQYFSTLVSNYRVQVGYGDAVNKRTKTQDRSRGESRKKGKLVRRTRALEAFQLSHDVTGLALLLEKDWMSSEDSEGPGNVSEVEWQAAASTVKVRGGGSPWEVIPLQWRSKQLVRLFYALDKISWVSEKSNNPRFHGLKANTNTDMPKNRPLRIMVDDTWFENNQKVKLKTNVVPPFDLSAITILDTELEEEDLAALADAEDNDQ